MYFIYGAEEVMYLLILIWVYFCPVAIIVILYLFLSYHLQVGRGNCDAVYGQ